MAGRLRALKPRGEISGPRGVQGRSRSGDGPLASVLLGRDPGVARGRIVWSDDIGTVVVALLTAVCMIADPGLERIDGEAGDGGATVDATGRTSGGTGSAAGSGTASTGMETSVPMMPCCTGSTAACRSARSCRGWIPVTPMQQEIGGNGLDDDCDVIKEEGCQSACRGRVGVIARRAPVSEDRFVSSRSHPAIARISDADSGPSPARLLYTAAGG